MIFVGLTNTTPGMLLGMIAPLLVVLAVGTVSCSVIAVIVGRIVHFDWRLSIAMAVTAFFGFPRYIPHLPGSIPGLRQDR